MAMAKWAMLFARIGRVYLTMAFRLAFVRPVFVGVCMDLHSVHCLCKQMSKLPKYGMRDQKFDRGRVLHCPCPAQIKSLTSNPCGPRFCPIIF